MKTIKFRIYDKQQNKMIESGATPTMLESFFEHTAVLHTKDEMPYQQFTGLLDKQGKEIYEGDILKTTAILASDKIDDNYFNVEVKWNICGWIANGSLGEYQCRISEVIGNIYENPELIK